MKYPSISKRPLHTTLATLGVLLGLLTPNYSKAAVLSTAGDGGDTRCQEFYNLASEVSIALAKLGQAKVNEVNPLIQVDFIRKQVMQPLKVTPVHHLARQALSDSEQDRTDLDVDQWDAIKSKTKKLDLVTHELMVLGGAEADGEYAVSKDARALLSASGAFEELSYSKADSYEVQPDGSVNFEFDDGFAISSSLNGICKLMSKQFRSAHYPIYFRYEEYRGLHQPPGMSRFPKRKINEKGVDVGVVTTKRWLTGINCSK